MNLSISKAELRKLEFAVFTAAISAASTTITPPELVIQATNKANQDIAIAELAT
jgi:hypothetical protein